MFDFSKKIKRPPIYKLKGGIGPGQYNHEIDLKDILPERCYNIRYKKVGVCFTRSKRKSLTSKSIIDVPGPGSYSLPPSKAKSIYLEK